MPRQWNDDRLRRQYERVKDDARRDGYSEDELASHYMDKLSHQTKSHRIMRMIRLAYSLGWLRGIAYVDEGKTPVALHGSIPPSNYVGEAAVGAPFDEPQEGTL